MPALPPTARRRRGVRLGVARMLAAGRLKSGQPNTGAHLVARSDRAVRQCPLCCRRRALFGLLPLVTDRHVDAFTLAGTVEEVGAHMSALSQAGVDSFIVMPLACEGSTAEETLVKLVRTSGRA